MHESAPAAGRAVEYGIKGLQHDVPVPHHEHQHGDCSRGGGEGDIRGAHREHVAEQELKDVQPSPRQVDQCDAGAEEHDEEGAEGGVLLHPRESAEQGASERSEKAGEQGAGEERGQAGSEQEVGRRDAGQQGVGEGIAHE